MLPPAERVRLRLLASRSALSVLLKLMPPEVDITCTFAAIVVAFANVTAPPELTFAATTIPPGAASETVPDAAFITAASMVSARR